jgi:mono/diheme cytochrome c family protein
MINSFNDKLIATLILLTVTTISQAAALDKGNADAGKKTFDQHKCNSCHASMLGGDGSAMFTRAERKVKTPASLLTQVARCSVNLGLMLFEEDEENIAAYLNKNYYKFK